jgi:hypothetical protein
MTITTVAELNRQIKRVFLEDKDLTFPVELEFNEGMEFPSYLITIEKIEKDFYIDKKGRKWLKA